MFTQGQKIVYPMHGIGQIEKIENGYYMIHIPHGDVHIRISLESAEKIGLRLPLGREEIEGLLQKIPTHGNTQGENWSQRYQENIRRLKSGKLEQAAEVVKSLLERSEKKQLSAVENRLLSMTKQIVLSEIISAYEMKEREAEELLAKWLKIG